MSVGDLKQWLGRDGRALEALAKGVKPPKGYTPIPGSKHNGYHKLVGGRWHTWYAHPDQRARAASTWAPVSLPATAVDTSADAIKFERSVSEGTWCKPGSFSVAEFNADVATAQIHAKAIEAGRYEPATSKAAVAALTRMRLNLHTLMRQYGITPSIAQNQKFWAHPGPVSVTPTSPGALGSYLPPTDAIEVVSLTLADGKDANDFERPSAQVGAGSTPGDIGAHTPSPFFKVILHECLHGASRSMARYEYVALVIEEATTELAAVAITKRAFGECKSATYQGFIGQCAHALYYALGQTQHTKYKLYDERPGQETFDVTWRFDDAIPGVLPLDKSYQQILLDAAIRYKQGDWLASNTEEAVRGFAERIRIAGQPLTHEQVERFWQAARGWDSDKPEHVGAWRPDKTVRERLGLDKKLRMHEISDVEDFPIDPM